MGPHVTILHSFGAFTNGANPLAPLVLGRDGNFYGTTCNGGTNGGNGTVFRMTPQGLLTCLYSFTGGNDGGNPSCALVQGFDGKFYGTTTGGGTNGGNGTVFRITAFGALTSLYSFTGGEDGSGPGSMTLGLDGDFYGPTSGTIFRITPEGALKTLATNIGASSLVLGSDGHFYGTTLMGGNGYGTVFSMTSDGVIKTLYSFSGDGVDDGSWPTGLVQGNDGVFYGTTSDFWGTIFKVTSSGAFTTLYGFTNGTDGQLPQTTLTLGKDGNLYGTVPGGEQTGGYVFFKITPSGSFSDVYSFPSSVGSASALVLGDDGNFYGTIPSFLYIYLAPADRSLGKLTSTVSASSGPINTAGGLFKISPSGHFANLRSFIGLNDGMSPGPGSLFGSGDGSFYGTSADGGENPNIDGSIFKWSFSGVFTITYSFQYEFVSLNLGIDGNLYGSGSPQLALTPFGSAIFEIPADGQFTNLYSFPFQFPSTNPPTLGPYDFADVVTPMVQGGNGDLYGAIAGGFINYEIIFSLTTNGDLTSLYDFTNGLDGQGPWSALVQGNGGNLYGCAPSGGSASDGLVFQMTTNGALTILYSFTNDLDGAYPLAPLALGHDGNFYGSTTQGGSNNEGTIFKIAPGGTLTSLYSFTNGVDGAQPWSALLPGSNGVFYGFTAGNGAFRNGSVFQITSNGVFTTLYSFTSGDGIANVVSLALGNPGQFYGTTPGGGAGGNGTLFLLSIPPLPVISNGPPGHLNEPVGSVLTLSATVNGMPSLTYQWQVNGIDLSDGQSISGSTNTALTINPLMLTNSGTYRLIVSNSYGVVTGAVTVLTVSADTVAPKIHISSPASDARTTNGVISGTASDNAQVVAVDYWLTNSNNGLTGTAGQAILGLGTTNRTWSIPGAPLPGSNTVMVQSVDFTGNKSLIRVRSFFYDVSTRFTLTHTGNGAVAGTTSIHGDVPPTNGAMLHIGESYTLVAHPAKDWLFSNWTGAGSVLSTNATLHFIMEPGCSVAANFVTNVFLEWAVAGTYNGLFAPANAPRQQTNSGAISFTVKTNGVLSGKLAIGTNTPSLTGQFNPAGVATITTRRKGLSTLTTTLQLDFSNQMVSGSVTDGSFDAQVMADLEQKATNYEGHYTLIIPGTNDPTVGPFGASCGTVTVSPLGAITFAWSLADGTSVSPQSSVVSQDGYWPFYVALYGGHGSLWSWNCFTNTNGAVITFSTNASWINATNSNKAAVYRAGFTNPQASIIGSVYTSTNKPLLALTSGQVILQGGNLPVPITNQIALASNNAITLTAAAENTNKLAITITKTNGVIRGTFVNPSNPRQTNRISGVLLQSQTNAQGYFLGTNQSGAFLLENP